MNWSRLREMKMSTDLNESVCEDNFCKHLTLGLEKTLGEIPGVEDICLEKREPCEKAAINSWEQRHSSILPYDLKNFYLSSDGFLLTWSYAMGGDIVSIGNLQINPLAKLQRIGGQTSTSIDLDGHPLLLDLDLLVPKNQQEIPLFRSSCKIFVLDSCREIATVCLVYMEHKLNPNIWLLDRSLEWHFMAPSFTQYFRMMLVCYGLPEWQLKITPMGLSPWAEQIMYSFMPHLNSPMLVRKNIVSSESQLDSSIFKMRTKHSRKAKQPEPNDNNELNKKKQTKDIQTVCTYTNKNH